MVAMMRIPHAATLAVALSLVSPLAAGPPDGSSALRRAPHAQAAPAEKLSRDWKRVRSANFEAVGNAPVADVSRMLEQLEAFRESLVARFLGLKTTDHLPTLIVVLRDAASFDRFKPRDEKGRKEDFVGAYFVRGNDMNLIVVPRMAQDAESQRYIFHEYYHFVVHRNVPNIPTWLDEGLAEFYSTSEFDPAAGQSVIGKPLARHLQLLRVDPLIPLDQLLSREGAGKVLRSGDPRRVAMFYAESWALVHYLMLSDNAAREPQVKSYLAAAGKGLPLEEAFRTAFGLTYADASRLLSEYAARSAFPVMTVRQNAVAASFAAGAAALTEAETEFIQGDLLLRLGVNDEADPALRKALALDPACLPAKVALGILLVAQDHTNDGIAALHAAAEADPGSFRAHLALATAYQDAERYADAMGEYSRAAVVNTRATAPWLGQALSALALGRLDDSDRAMDRLQSLELRPEWYRTRAYEAFRLGSYGAAARDVRTYLDKAGRGAEGAPYMAFLGAICHWRLSQPAEADATLAEVRPGLAEASWPARLMDFMQGRLAADQLVSSAKDVEQRTEAHAYVGFKALQAGRRDEGLGQLRWVEEHGTKVFNEYGMAVAELKRIEKKP
jgi:tetratricopeptide (TPR) repeat protein